MPELYPLSDKAKVDMLRKLALFWDGQWFLKTVDEIGLEAFSPALITLARIGLGAAALAPLFGVPWYATLLALATAVPIAWRNRRRTIERAYEGDGINDLTLDTFAVHLLLETGFLAPLLVAGILRWGL